MRFLKWALGGIAVLILVLVIVGMLLPREVRVERAIMIDAPASEVFPHINSLKATEAWSPWLGIDPDVQTRYNAIPEGVGAAMTWSSEHPNVGAGSMEVVESIENVRVASSLDFGDMGTAQAIYDLEEFDDQTEVTWALIADMGAGPVGRWMGLMMDNWVGADYERGLANLKALVEN